MSQFVNANGNTLLNLNFSLEEQETGLYWIDGKKIYCKVILVTGFDSEDKYVPHNISDLNRVLSCDLFIKTSDGTNHMMPRAHKDDDHDGISIHKFNSASWKIKWFSKCNRICNIEVYKKRMIKGRKSFF